MNATGARDAIVVHPWHRIRACANACRQGNGSGVTARWTQPSTDHAPGSLLLSLSALLSISSPLPRPNVARSLFLSSTRLARFPCFFTLASTFAFCLWLVHAQGATDSNCLGGHQTRPPLPFSPSLSSFVRSSLSNQWTLLSLRSLHSIRPLYRSNFSLSLLAVSAYISLVFHFAWNKSAIILIQLSTIFSPIAFSSLFIIRYFVRRKKFG